MRWLTFNLSLLLGHFIRHLSDMLNASAIPELAVMTERGLCQERTGSQRRRCGGLRHIPIMQDTDFLELWNCSVEALAEVEAIRSGYSVHNTFWYFEPIRDEDDDDLNMSGPFWSEVQRQVDERFLL